MRNLSTLATATGPQGNSLLFTTVITQYDGKLNLMTDAIAAIEDRYVEDLYTNQLGRAEPFALFAGVDQPLAYQAAEFSTMTCGGADNPLPAPVDLKTQIENFDRYNLADYLKMGTTKSCWFGKLLNPKRVCKPGQEVCDVVGTLQTTVNVIFDTVPIAAQSWTSGLVTLQGEETATEYVTKHWLSLKAGFEANAAPVAPTPELAARRAALLNTTTAKLETTLAEFQHNLYGRVLNEMTNGSLQTLAVETAGGKALLDTVVTLGMPRAIADDEFVHAMLFGNQQLVDDRQILQSYAISFTQPITNINVQVNPRLVIG